MIKWENPALISLAFEAEVRGFCDSGTGDSGDCFPTGINAAGDCEPGVSAATDCESGTGPARYCSTGTTGITED